MDRRWSAEKAKRARTNSQTAHTMPDSEGARPPKTVDWSQVWQRLDGVIQLWLLLACIVIPAAHFILHRTLFTVRQPRLEDRECRQMSFACVAALIRLDPQTRYCLTKIVWLCLSPTRTLRQRRKC